MLKMMSRLSTTQIVSIGFFGVIIVGALLLELPFASVSEKNTPFIDALFTATTSVCVTGLVTVTTAAHWTIFGKIVILFLIQLGGLGVITVMITGLLFLGRKITLKERLLIQQSYNLDTLQGLVKLILRIIKITLFIEALGAIAYCFVLVPKFGISGVGMAIFNSVSAFCNAGMDIIQDDSLESFVFSPIMNFMTMFLIILGGIGFPVIWEIIDTVRSNKLKNISGKIIWKRLSLHSKIVITTTIFLIFGGALLIFLLEYTNQKTIGPMNIGNKIMASLFQSVTTRTAGFQTLPQQNFRDGTSFIFLILMFIGGSPAGTAGGIKTTSIALLLYTVVSVVKGRKDTEAFKRKISVENIRTALAVILISFSVLVTSTLLLLTFENGSFLDLLFEVCSAIGTVGLTRGITTKLSLIGKIIIIITMYLGRIGPITMALAFGNKRKVVGNMRELPEKNVIIG